MKIMEDKRTITGIKISDGQTNYRGKYTQIEPYEENGEMAPVVWFKIFYADPDLQGEAMIARVNGKFVSQVSY